MICPDCNGSGRRGATLMPCEGCIGGVASCCDPAGSEGTAEALPVHRALASRKPETVGDVRLYREGYHAREV